MSFSRTSSQSTTAKSKNKQDKIKVFVKHTCYICGDVFSKAAPTINHVKTIHGYIIPTRLVGRKRPQNDRYEYVADNNDSNATEEYTCPSCWFHCPDTELLALKEHTHDKHGPVKVVDTKEDDDDGYVFVALAKSSNNHGCTTGRKGNNKRPATNGNPNNNGPTAEELSRKLDELNDVFQAFFC